MFNCLDSVLRATPALPVLAAVGLLLAGCGGARQSSEPVRVAVAANFTATQEKLASTFTEQTGIALESSFGASGALYSQIVNGAPFQVFLSADSERPERLEKEGLVSGEPFTYALGALALYVPGGVPQGHGEELLKAGAYPHLAICKPELAPYGLAARQTLEKLGLWESVQPKLVQGDNVTQAFQFVETGNAEAGLVALSQVLDRRAEQIWRVPGDLHDPIRQDAVLLKNGEGNPGAEAFATFLKGPEARAIIAAGGYTLPGGAE